MKLQFAVTAALLSLNVFPHLEAQRSDSGVSMTLQKCIDYSLINNVQNKLSAYDYKQAKWDEKKLRSYALPHISLDGKFENYMKLPVLIIPGEILGEPGMNIPVEFGTQYNINAAVQVSQLLYNQSYFTSREMARKASEITGLSIEKTREEVSAEVAKLYWYVVTTREQIRILNKTKDNISQLYSLTELQYDNGLIKASDLKKMEVNSNNLSVQVMNLENLYSEQISMLKFISGLPECISLVPSDSLNTSYFQFMHDNTIEDIPELMILEKKQEMDLLAIKANRQEYLPTLTAFGSYAYQAQREEFDMFKSGDDKWFEIGVVGINLSIPILNGFERNCKIQHSKIEYDKTRLQAKNARRHFNTEYQNANYTWTSSRNSMEMQQENLRLARTLYNHTRNEYLEGISSLADLVMAQNSLLEAESLYTSSLLKLRIAEIDLIKASGNMHLLITK
jgi:outer membrane protein TolC